MNFINALAPWQWAIMAAIPPLIVLLYFLKLRRNHLLVPSTFLWQRAIEDMQVNSLWQRLRQNLLLLLQLLFIAALIFACLRPGFHSQGNSGTRKIFLIDTSASMQATDVSPSRLDVAKSKIREQINNMSGDDVAMLIAFSNRADVRQGFTQDKSRLFAALDSTAATNRTSDVGEALRAAAGLANPGRSSFGDMTDLQVADALPAEIEIYSDGRFASVNEFNIGNLSPKYIPIGDANSENLAITAFSLDRTNINAAGQTGDESSGGLQAYARVLNASKTTKTVTLSLRGDDALLDAAELEIPAEESRGATFQISNSDPTVRYQVELEPTKSDESATGTAKPDVLRVDDSAVAAIRPNRQIEVLVVSPGSQALLTALATATIADIAKASFIDPPTYKNWSESNFAPPNAGKTGSNQLGKAFDLVIFDGVDVMKLPPANTLHLGGRILYQDDAGPEKAESEIETEKPEERWRFGPDEGPVLIIDSNRANAIMQYLTVGNLRIVQGHSVDGPAGSEVLMRGDNGTLLSVGPRGAFQDAVLGFGLRATIDGEQITNTDWPIKRSFPVFVYAVMQNLAGAMTSRNNLSIRPGEPAVLSLSPRINDFLIFDPSGKSQPISRDSSGQVVWTATDRLGLYRVTLDDTTKTPVDNFVVNLASAQESSIATASAIQFGYEDVQATPLSTSRRREWWRWLLGIGLILLVAEWAVFSRRVG